MLRYFLSISVLCVFAFAGIHQISKVANQSIIGEWKEVSWNYAKSDKENKIEDNEAFKYELASHLVVHQFEQWNIRSNNRMEFRDASGSKHVCNWYLKGRGHILELVHPDHKKETYVIKSINDTILELHVETAVHARGILKIVLTRTNEKV